jgi:hypothetical protein
MAIKKFAVGLSVIGLFVCMSCANVEKQGLLPGAFFKPDKVKSPDIETSQVNLRFGNKFLLYVPEAGKISVTMSRQDSEQSGTAGFSVLSPAGLKQGDADVGMGKSGTLTFTAEKAGPYTVLVDAARLDFTLDAEGAKILLPASEDQPFHGYARNTSLFFYVPPGARKFEMLLRGQGYFGETAKASVLGPDGVEVAVLNATGKIDEKVIPVPDGADGSVWAVMITKGDAGVLGDFEMILSGDVGAYVVERPEDLFCPVLKVASSRLVSGDKRDPLPCLAVTCFTELSALKNVDIEFTVKRDADAAVIHSQKLHGVDERKFEFCLSKRPAAGNYQWSVTLRRNGKSIGRFDGSWYFTPSPNFITKDGMTLVDGKPFFARGLYHVNRGDYSMVKEHGFNAVQCHADDVAAVDAAGLKAGVALYWGIKHNRDISTTPDSERWRAKIDRLADSKSIFAWWLQDEPDGQFDSRNSLAGAYAYLRQQDPDRPAFLCLCEPEKYEYFAAQTDIVAMDIYPIPDRPINTIADGLSHVKEVAPGAIPLFIGQADGKMDDPKKHRCMTYLSIAHGARGLFWYTLRDPNWFIPTDAPELWAEMKKVNDELILLESALLKKNLAEQVFGTLPQSIHTCLKQVDEQFYIIAVNPNGGTIDSTIDLGMLAPGIAVEGHVDVLFESHRTQSLDEGMIRDKFEPLAVHIYRLTIK